MHISEKTRDIILNAAKDLFAQKGFFKTTYADIARYAGVNQATVYRGFKTKENIFKILLEQEYEQIRKETIEAATREKTTLGKLRKLITTNLTLTTQSKFFKYILFDEYTQFRNHFKAKEEEILKEIRSMIEEGIAKGEIKQEDPAFIMAVLLAFRYSLLNLHKNGIGSFESKYSLDHIIEIMNKIFIDGFLINYSTNNTIKSNA